MNQESKKKYNYITKPSRLKNTEPMRPYPNEIWKEYKVDIPDGDYFNRRYAFSNFGRFGSFHEGIEKDLYLASESIVLGYKVCRLWYRKFYPEKGKFDRGHHSVGLHKALAELFIPKPSADHIFVIHKDYDRLNNELENLAWVTKDQLTAHAQANPKVIASKPRVSGKGQKLTTAKVIQIKKLLKEKKTRMRIIAMRFNISMTLLEYIQKGKRWGHVEV